jgi:cbb3-type cytochrome oxidase subunit 3
MDLGTVTLLLGAGVGLLLTIFGVTALVTGRAPTARAFRTVQDAGVYYILFGVALMALSLGTTVRGIPAVISSVLAVVLVAVAMIRYRPRGRRRAEEEKEDKR